MLKLKHRDGLLPNTLAFSYVIIAYPLALAGLFHSIAWPFACLLLAHVLVIAAYLFHECAHNTLFADNADNARMGAVLSFLTGGCYTPYAQLRDKHFRHHVQREDVLAVNAHRHLQQYPLLKKLLCALAWLHVPAFEIYTHLLALFAPFYLSGMAAQRRRVIALLLVRGFLFLLLASLSLKAALLYFVAWMLMVLVLNFMDAFQHTYRIDYSLMGKQRPPAFDAQYEASHTWSNLLSEKHPRLNLLVLNFCYHNAHHHKPNEPWYRLPALHREYYPQACAQQIPFAEQLKRFHQYRVQRLNSEGLIDEAGIDGVNFLVGV